MECFDISHTQGEATVASCVVFGGQGPLNAEYRQFNIKDVAKGDDYAAMKQVIRRRYTRLVKEYNEKTGGICAELPNNKIMYLYRHSGICNYWIYIDMYIDTHVIYVRLYIRTSS